MPGEDVVALGFKWVDAGREYVDPVLEPQRTRGTPSPMNTAATTLLCSSATALRSSAVSSRAVNRVGVLRFDTGNACSNVWTKTTIEMPAYAQFGNDAGMFHPNPRPEVPM